MVARSNYTIAQPLVVHGQPQPRRAKVGVKAWRGASESIRRQHLQGVRPHRLHLLRGRQVGFPRCRLSCKVHALLHPQVGSQHAARCTCAWRLLPAAGLCWLLW